MSDFSTIEYAVEGGVARITMDRPEVRNAFNDVMIGELDEALRTAAGDEGARVLVLTGKGKVFSAGADLGWMRKMKDFSYEENLDDALRLSHLLHRLYTLPLPTVAAVNGATIGGGAGLAAACDIAVASHHAIFSLSEVRIGLVPACIGPYVLRRVGERAARELFLTGERISAERAREEGLVNDVAAAEGLKDLVADYTGRLMRGGPQALQKAKKLVREISEMNLETAGEYTAQMIARLRITPEAQEGMAAFLDKRKPEWLGS